MASAVQAQVQSNPTSAPQLQRGIVKMVGEHKCWSGGAGDSKDLKKFRFFMSVMYYAACWFSTSSLELFWRVFKLFPWSAEIDRS